MKSLAASLAVAAAALFGGAGATEYVDQSNTRLAAMPAIPTLAIGGSSEQKIAQTFTVGVTGSLVKLRLPLSCEDGALVIDIVEQAAGGLPTGRVLRRTNVPASSVRRVLPDPPDFIDVTLVSPVSVTAGQKLAFVMTNATGSCGVGRAEAGETYGGGEGYFISLPDTPAWQLLDLDGVLSSDPSDLAFETVMDDGSGGGSASACGVITLPGGGSVPADLPICRCLRDAGLREFRCALLDPDFFAIRRIPWPIPINSTYVERWDVLPLTKFDGPMRIDFAGVNIPKGAGFTFYGKNFKALESRAMTLKSPGKPIELPGSAVISLGGRKFQVDTTLPADAFGPNAKPDFKSIKVPPQQ